ncbi:hypothetical protein J437_LFUL005457 [Ladona fulva]|uniref:Uncharacterized protein n=1 Tax=Ladona fulva TaxID=123851 RepID=A0A8K0NYU8_LADFU|nr:hypothetical protein J437_LFUL005457 [Ladona fulva]
MRYYTQSIKISPVSLKIPSTERWDGGMDYTMNNQGVPRCGFSIESYSYTASGKMGFSKLHHEQILDLREQLNQLEQHHLSCLAQSSCAQNIPYPKYTAFGGLFLGFTTASSPSPSPASRTADSEPSSPSGVPAPSASSSSPPSTPPSSPSASSSQLSAGGGGCGGGSPAPSPSTPPGGSSGSIFLGGS